MGVQVEVRPWRGMREMVLPPFVIKAMRWVWYVDLRAGMMVVRRVRRVLVKVGLGRVKRAVLLLVSVVMVLVRVAMVWPGVVGW